MNNGSIDGCDVVVPSLAFTMSRSSSGILTIGFIKTISEYTGRINSEPFLSFNIGDVLLERVNGSQSFTDDGPFIDISYTFRVCPTVYNLRVGDINVGYKAGWDSFWVEYKKVFDYDCVSNSMKPRAAYIEEVYKTADFNSLLATLI